MRRVRTASGSGASSPRTSKPALKREAAQVAKKVAEIEQLRSLMKAGTLS